MLYLIGGTLGIGAAKYMASEFGFPLVLDVPIMVIAIGVSGLVGVIFGLYGSMHESECPHAMSSHVESRGVALAKDQPEFGFGCSQPKFQLQPPFPG